MSTMKLRLNVSAAIMKIISYFLILNQSAIQVTTGFLLSPSSLSFYGKSTKTGTSNSETIPLRFTFHSTSFVKLSSTTQRSSGNSNSSSKNGRTTQRNKKKKSKLKNNKKNGRHTKDELNDLVRSKFDFYNKNAYEMYVFLYQKDLVYL